MPTIEGPGSHSVSVQEAITGDRLFVHVDQTGIRQNWTLVSTQRSAHQDVEVFSLTLASSASCSP